jgi:AcrR family transcriptional regulator
LTPSGENAIFTAVVASSTDVDERRALIDAGIAVLRRQGSEGCTVADVLDEATLSTRAFYRHFGSKDELVLAIYEHDARATQTRLRERMDAASSPRAALEVWIDETLALGFDSRRARRTRPLAKEGLRLQAEFPAQFAAIVDGVINPLAEVLCAFPAAHPERDARSIHAVAWSLVAERLAGGAITRDEARAHVLRFCLPVIGAAR